MAPTIATKEIARWGTEHCGGDVNAGPSTPSANADSAQDDKQHWQIKQKRKAMRAKTAVVLGAQWGDEGKGKIVDVLSERFSAVARYAGGRTGAAKKASWRRQDGCIPARPRLR